MQDWGERRPIAFLYVGMFGTAAVDAASFSTAVGPDVPEAEARVADLYSGDEWNDRMSDSEYRDCIWQYLSFKF